jgi:spore coat protein U-like protein
LNFGDVDTLGNTATTSTADISVSCDGASEAQVTVCGNFGTGNGGVIGGVRQSKAAGGGTLGFGLYASSGGAVPWGSVTATEYGAPHGVQFPVSNGSAAGSLSLHGVVPAGQSSAAIGDYSSDFLSDAFFTYADGDLDCAAPVGGTDLQTPFAVTARVVANCALITSDLDFGTSGKIGDNIDAETDLSLTCTAGTDYTISIDGGGAHDPNNRLLRSGDNSVSYGLYSDASRHDVWGTASGSTVSGDGDGTEQTHGVYGRIPPQPAAAGAYADTVVVTISY